MLRQGVSLVARILASSAKISENAGTVIRSILKSGDLKIIEKGINDLQTEADRSAQTSIVASLRSRFGDGLCVIGEEDSDINPGDAPPSWIEKEVCPEVLSIVQEKAGEEFNDVRMEDLVVWVDPLDGTSEFTQGLLDHVTVLIGIALKGAPIAGVIHQPYFNYQNPNAVQGRTIWGMKGVGVYGMSVVTAPSEKRIVTTTRSHSDKIVQKAVDAMSPDEVIRVGGAGHKVLMVLEGQANAYVFASRGCKKWDTCAPEAVLLAAGGKLTDLHGNRLGYNKEVQRDNSGGVLATLGSDHGWFLSRVPQEVKDSLPPLLRK